MRLIMIVSRYILQYQELIVLVFIKMMEYIIFRLLSSVFIFVYYNYNTTHATSLQSCTTHSIIL